MSDADRREAAIEAGAVAPFLIGSLHLALKARLEVLAARFPLLETKTPNKRRAPNVIDGWLPPKTADEDFPFLILRPSEGDDSIEGADQVSTAKITIIVGTFSDTNQGFLDALLLVDAIRSDLGEQPSLAGTPFEHYGPLTWRLPEQSWRPQWFGTVTTVWNIARPRRIEALNPEEA